MTALSLHTLARALGGKICGDHVRAPGPGHSQNDNSLSVALADTEDGFVVKTFSPRDDDLACKDYVRAKLGLPKWKPNGSASDIIDRMGGAARLKLPLSLNTAKKQRASDLNGAREPRRIVAAYSYADEHGALLYQSVRYEPKDFRQRRPDPDKPGEWVWNMQGVRRVPYRLAEVLAADTVFIVEGERDADNLAALGLVATTCPEGAGKWKPDLNQWFAGKSVYIVPDNDEPGRKHAQQVAENLHEVAAEVRVVRLPGLPEKGDVSDWLGQGGDKDRLLEIVQAAPLWEPEAEATAEAEAPAESAPLTVEEWLGRDIPSPDFLMSELLSTTSRVLLVAPTGLGKTMVALSLGAYMSSGRDFLHWKSRRPARVLYIDGEMSRRLLKQRLADVVRRLGERPQELFILSHEDIPNFAPLNTPEGQAQIEVFITKIGGVDFIVFDNIMSLIGGDQKDEEGWRQTLPWVRDLTRRGIGQMWIHHTGHDETRSYGTKTREWQLDTVIHLERVERADTDVSFRLGFRKARERTPDNRDDFQEVTVALVNDEWMHEGGSKSTKTGPISPMARKFLDALSNVVTTTTFQGWKAVTTKAWQSECVVLGLIDKDDKPASARALFSRYRRELIAARYVACNGDLTWRL